MWPRRIRSPEYQELAEIVRKEYRWAPILAALPVSMVFTYGMKYLDANGIHGAVGWAWLVGSGVALLVLAALWQRSQARLDEVQRRISSEAAGLTFPTLLFLLFALALLDSTFKFPARIDGDSVYYVVAFGALLIHAGWWALTWRRYFPTK